MSSQESTDTSEVIQSTALATVTPAPLPKPKPRRWGGMDEVQGGPLQSWMKEFCHWLVTTKPKPKTCEQTRYATELAGIVIHRRALTWVKERKDFDAYYTLLSAHGLERAKHKMLGDLEFYAELHRLGAEMAMNAGDHRSIAAYTVPALDRILPRRQETVHHDPVVVIQVTQNQADKLRDTEPLPNEIVVEAVVVEEESA